MMEQLLHPRDLLDGTWSLSRRALLRGAGALLAGGALLAAGIDLLGRPTHRPLELRRSTFAGHLGERMWVDLGPQGSLALELAAVQALPYKPSDDEHSFRITLSGPADRALRQDTYSFSHYRLGDFPLFIVPMGVAANTQRYEAIFN